MKKTKKDRLNKVYGSKKGQLSMVNIVSWFALCIVGVILTIILYPFITLSAASALANNRTLDSILMYMIIPFMWLAILVTLLTYAQPNSGFRQF